MQQLRKLRPGLDVVTQKKSMHKDDRVEVRLWPVEGHERARLVCIWAGHAFTFFIKI